MESATAMLQAGVILGIVLLGQVAAERALPADTVPNALRGRVDLCHRLRPWLMVAAAVLALTGLVLQVL